MLEEYLAFWRPRLEVDTRMRVAVLTSDDWGRVTELPYAFANNFGPPANLMLAPAAPPAPSGLDTVLVSDRGDRRDWLLIGHEGGHLLTWALLPPAMRDGLTLPPERTSADLRERYERIESIPQWYWEFAATCFATAFLEGARPAEAADWTRYQRALAAVPTPRFTHLDDWFGELMRAKAADGTPYFLSGDGGANFGWYQGVVGLLGAHVLGRAEKDFVAHLRRMVSGEAAPTTAEILAELESMAPGALALLDGLDAGYGPPSTQR